MSRRALAGGILGGAALVAVVTLAARAFGFGRWLVFAGTVDAQCVGTAYTTANQLPNVLYEVVAGGALAAAVVPLLASPLARGERAEVERTASALLTWAVLLLLPASLLLAALAGPVSRLMLGGEGCEGQAALTARLLLVFSPQVVLYGVGVVLTGVLQAHRRFLWPVVAPLLSSVVVIVAYVVFSTLAEGATDDAAALPASAEAVLAWGTTAGVAVLTLPLLVPVLRTGTRLRPTLRFPAGAARRAAALAGAGVVALLAQQAAVLVALRLANGSGDGAWPVFQYVQAVYLLPYAILAVPLATVAFPRLAHEAATDDHAAFSATAARTTRAVLLVAVLGAVVLAAGAPAVTTVFARLGEADVSVMTPALAAIAPGLLGFAVVAHVGRALNALHRPRAAAVATGVGWLGVAAASTVAVLASADTDGAVVALSLGNTVGMLLAGVLLLVALARAAGRGSVAGVPRTLLVASAAGAVGALAGRLLGDALLDSLGTGVAAALVAGAVGALAGAALLTAGVAAGDRATVREALALVQRRSAA